MNYYVIWPDGRKFGPADEPTLAQWAHEGRVDASTELEEVETGNRIKLGDLNVLEAGWEEPAPKPRELEPNEYEVQQAIASDEPVGETKFEIPQEYPLTSGSPYPVESYYQKTKSDVNTAWGLSVAGLVCSFLTPCCCLMFAAGVTMTSVGVYYSDRAVKKGDLSANSARLFGIVALVIEVLLIVAYFGFYGFMMLGAGRGGKLFP